MLQQAIVPVDAKPIHFYDYETGMERWVSLISQALQYRINLPDPTTVLAYYENIILGGTSPTGTLEQYPGIQRKYLAWKDEHELVYLRASHGDRLQKLISEFHTKVLQWRTVMTPKDPQLKKKKGADDEAARRGDADPSASPPPDPRSPPGGGKTKDQKDKGKDKGAGKDGKKKGKPDSGGAGGASSPGKGRDEKPWKLEDQPVTFFKAPQEDGYQKAMCTSFILDGKCQWGNDCIYALHGGHPARVTDEMKRAIQARKDQKKAKKKRQDEYEKQKKKNIETKRRLDAGEEE